jgi:hypothetical protein
VASLYIPHALAKREFDDDGAGRIEAVAAWRKGVFASLPAKGVAGHRLLKAYVTTVRGPRRTLFLLQSASGDAIFLFHRPKGDPLKALDKAMALALREIEAGRFDVVSR